MKTPDLRHLTASRASRGCQRTFRAHIPNVTQQAGKLGGGEWWARKRGGVQFSSWLNHNTTERHEAGNCLLIVACCTPNSQQRPMEVVT